MEVLNNILYVVAQGLGIPVIIARIASMFGLMGTLIPLGPGIMALSSGDLETLSSSLAIAFNTTIAGLVSASARALASA